MDVNCLVRKYILLNEVQNSLLELSVILHVFEYLVPVESSRCQNFIPPLFFLDVLESSIGINALEIGKNSESVPVFTLL